MQNKTTQWRWATQFLEKYSSHFIWKGCVWEGVGDRTELQHIDPHQRFFPVLLGCSTGSLGAQPLWDMFLNPASSHQLVWSSNCSIGGLRVPSAECWLSLPHLVTNGSGLQTDWISCALSYIIVQRTPSSCGRHNCTHSTHPRSKVIILIFLDRMHLLFT